MPYPGFPTDMQSIFGSILTVSKGTSIIVENIFENRYKYLNELKRMGAKVTIEGRTAVIKGVKRLSGATVNSTDLRGGAALVTAALNAKGTTTVQNIEYILRGYEKLYEKLQNLGAKIYIKNT
jgi:UDP-N-acetylglucosamine 1-carboxyvinyltransferase